MKFLKYFKYFTVNVYNTEGSTVAVGWLRLNGTFRYTLSAPSQ